ncbi:lytic transglycosylase domain-containing protein [Massilia antarctica]|uniref:lytic transglycosylase domain-containing protein n=1 Tax=Massilia antarctica TaxID=2765360 RepID=UPI0006BC7A7E|nr:lytic transglycosylase domain-containing protein [Massilia sp. H27-R4]MCY0913999.1 lytic transglycosylase domain-containing protein [Massilia sp. H27-R4]CUI04260.1 Soluble lytic murein transglycosylase and related regulatory proteins (some contain LysM/invasin domains) [Janthinobacterium sp. CG23_2]CUU28046.1 Soluble lytic murein transglycosylase and related regulatory proteins (some contain LysM/invasin domains) [Janthinobacterium sp. CG23_2]
MQHTLTFFGVSALAMMALLYLRPELAHEASQLLAPPHKQAPVVVRAPVQAPALSALMTAPAPTPAPRSSPAPAMPAPDEPPILALDEKASKANRKQQEFVTTWLSKRYRVAGDAANMLVSTAYSTAREIKLDPLLILAVMAIESGLNPFAESPVGAQGLMQVMSKIHHEKFQDMGGTKAALNPVANIRVGSLILKEYVKRGGSVEAGLKTYVGAAAFETDQGYGSRVMNEYQKLKLVASGKKVPTVTTPAAPKPVMGEKASQEQIARL